MNRAYRDNKLLPKQIQTWLDDQNDYERKHGLKISTSCCMQASLSFNATVHPIPSTGSASHRDNTKLSDGKYYILAVDEFRAHLTYKYGPTDKIIDNDLASIQGKPGAVIFGGWHIEFWDGANIFQSAEGCAKRAKQSIPVNAGCVMMRGIEFSGER